MALKKAPAKLDWTEETHVREWWNDWFFFVRLYLPNLIVFLVLNFTIITMGAYSDVLSILKTRNSISLFFGHFDFWPWEMENPHR